MTVNVTKPQINLREKLSEVDKPSGIAGEAILRSETPQEVFNYIGAGRRNLIINGAMQVAQRGTSATNVSSSSYPALDRWIYFISGAATNVSQESFTLGQTDVSGEPEFFVRNTVGSNSSSGNYSIMAQHIEDVRTLAGQTATLSFWAKSSVNGNKIGVELNQSFGGGSSRVTTVDSKAVTLSTSWQKFSVTLDVASISGKTIGTTAASFLELYFWFSGGSGWNSRSSSIGNQSGDFDIAQVQLEVGKVATPFEHRSFGEELALCQRYFRRLAGTNIYAGYGVGLLNTPSSGILTYPLVPSMRSAPSVSGNNQRMYDGSASAAITAYNTNRSSTNSFWIEPAAASSSFTIGRAFIVGNNNNSSGYMDLDSEL